MLFTVVLVCLLKSATGFAISRCPQHSLMRASNGKRDAISIMDFFITQVLFLQFKQSAWKTRFTTQVHQYFPDTREAIQQ